MKKVNFGGVEKEVKIKQAKDIDNDHEGDWQN